MLTFVCPPTTHTVVPAPSSRLCSWRLTLSRYSHAHSPCRSPSQLSPPHALPLLPSRARQPGVEVLIDCDGSLPAVGDVTKLRQIVTNLTSNSLKFTESGSVTLSASRSDPDDTVVLAVQDTGPGIPADQRSNLFTK